jgi:hypothetical protein
MVTCAAFCPLLRFPLALISHETRLRVSLVDLTLVTGIDHAGRELLEKWRVEGAGIVVNSSAAKDRIESTMDLPMTLLGKKTKQYA